MLRYKAANNNIHNNLKLTNESNFWFPKSKSSEKKPREKSKPEARIREAESSDTHSIRYYVWSNVHYAFWFNVFN